MNYETVAAFSQSAVLLLFVALFVGILVYVLWPSNSDKFDRASRRALDLDEDTTDGGVR